MIYINQIVVNLPICIVMYENFSYTKFFFLACNYTTRSGRIVDVFNDSKCNQKCIADSRVGGSCLSVDKSKVCTCNRGFSAPGA